MTRRELQKHLPALRASGMYDAEPLLLEEHAPPQLNDSEYVLHSLASRELLKQLQSGLVQFKFARVTYGGTPRRAIGTLNQQLFDYSFKGGTAPNKPGLFRYWDVVKADWRSFYLANVSEHKPFVPPGLDTPGAP